MALLGLAACGGATDPADGAPTQRPAPADGRPRDAAGIPLDAPVPEAARARVRAFLEAMVRPPLEETSDVHDRWFHRWRAMQDELEASGDEDIGNAALHAFTGDVSDGTITRRALLIIGTRCAPKSAAPLLRELTMEYGYRLDDRAEAALLWPEADPEGYMAELESHLRRRRRPDKTMPNDEFLVRGWITACERTGRSPVSMCADVATNMAMEPMARYEAAEELGRHPDDPLAHHALETCLIESSGDGYLRRKAAQAIRRSYPAEDACALFTDVLSKEADVNFASFLADVIQLLGCR